jgi:DNA-binding winged helix-turn-helix (wHTH) protein
MSLPCGGCSAMAANGNRYLVNIPGRGYRFVAPVTVVENEIPPLPLLQPVASNGSHKDLPA